LRKPTDKERGGMGVRPEYVAVLAENLRESVEYHRATNTEHFDFLFPCSQEVLNFLRQLFSH
jgi:hypothetical protein